MAQVIQPPGEILKQSTTRNRVVYFQTTGQTLTINISKNGAAFIVATGAATEIANGWYNIALSANDTNTVGPLAYHITAASGGPLDLVDLVQPTIFSDIPLDINGNVPVTSNIKKNQLHNGLMFAMTDSTLHGLKTGLTVSAQRSLDGAAFVPTANAPTEVGNGIYAINLNASDCNGNNLALLLTATNADPLVLVYITQP